GTGERARHPRRGEHLPPRGRGGPPRSSGDRGGGGGGRTRSSLRRGGVGLRRVPSGDVRRRGGGVALVRVASRRLQAPGRDRLSARAAEGPHRKGVEGPAPGARRQPFLTSRDASN